MNDRLFELEITKILQEYKLLLIDEEYKNEIISLNKADFIKRINEKGGFPNEEPVVPKVDVDDEVDSKDDLEDESDEKDSSIKEGIKKLYRKIVKLTHPDKTSHKNNKKELTDLYIRAKKAMISLDIYEILTICDRLDIEYIIDINQKAILEENLLTKKGVIKSLESSFIWLWINAKDDIEKESIVDLFIEKHKKNI